jgi:hypothetical protein
MASGTGTTDKAHSRQRRRRALMSGLPPLSENLKD